MAALPFKTFYVQLDTTQPHPSELFTVEAYDYRYDERVNKLLFYTIGNATGQEREEIIAEYDFGRSTRVYWKNGNLTEGFDDAHRNPQTRVYYHVGTLPAGSLSAAERSQAQEEQVRQRKTFRIEASTYAFNDGEDKLIFYNDWSERVRELAFGPETWVRREDEAGQLKPELPYELPSGLVGYSHHQNPKAGF